MKTKPMLFFIFSILVFMLVIMLKLHIQMKIIGLGYKINQVENRRRMLLQEKKQLDIELQYQKNPSKVEEMSKQMAGMKIPSTEQVVHIRSSSYIRGED